MRLCTTPVRKTEEKAQKVSNSQSAKQVKKAIKHPSKRNSNKHAGTRRHSSRDSAQNRVPQSHGATSPAHDSNKITSGRQKPTKKASKRTLQKSQQTHPKMVPTCLLFEDITRQRNSEFDTLHATDPAWKSQIQNPKSDCSERSRTMFSVSPRPHYHLKNDL